MEWLIIGETMLLAGASTILAVSLMVPVGLQTAATEKYHAEMHYLRIRLDDGNEETTSKDLGAMFWERLLELTCGPTQECPAPRAILATIDRREQQPTERALELLSAESRADV